MQDSIGKNIWNVRQFFLSRLKKSEGPSLFGYRLLTEGTGFRVYERPIAGQKLEAAWENAAVLTCGRRTRKLRICPDVRYPSLSRSVPFDQEHFPGLLPNSKIVYCRVIPYLRRVSGSRIVKSWRVLVATDHEQLYHNFPARDSQWEGESRWGDMIRFEESAVWDLPGRKFPTSNRNCREDQRFYPGLPKEAYACHPGVDQPSPYGNAGFPAVYEIGGQKLSRFYVARRIPEANPFFYMSGFSADNKMALLGTYQSNVKAGVRTCIFASDDGGRQWFCKYEFGDLGEYAFQQGYAEWGHNFGNPIMAEACKTGEAFSLRKRTCVVPREDCKEPDEKFHWGDRLQFAFCGGEKKMELRSSVPHGLQTGNIVAVTAAPESLSWMVNGTADENSAGNGLLFKVEVRDDKTLALYEFVASPDNPISCRHIHHINRVRDGWLIGTGEVYPNSWLLYMQMKEADYYAPRSAAEDFEIHRLNSTESSVQRTMGVVWKEDGDNTVFYASDHDDLAAKQRIRPIAGRSVEFSRNATGVYRGKLADIDDCNRFTPVYEAVEPAYLFREIRGTLVFSGQGGELALSRDNGRTWESSRLPGPLNHPRGGNSRYEIFDEYLLELK